MKKIGNRLITEADTDFSKLQKKISKFFGKLYIIQCMGQFISFKSKINNP